MVLFALSMSEKYKQTPEKPSFSAKLGKRLGAAAFSFLPLVTLEGNASQSAIDREAAWEAAQRFHCELGDVQDLHQRPKHSPAGEQRTTVKLRVDLSINPEAKEALNRYKDDGAVGWFPPTVGAQVGEFDVLNRPIILMSEQHNEPVDNDNPGSLEATAYPRTTYEDGTEATVYVQQEVDTSDDDNLYRTVGYTPCGTMTFRNGSWELTSPDSQFKPFVSVTEHPWQTPKVYQSK